MELFIPFLHGGSSHAPGAKTATRDFASKTSLAEPQSSGNCSNLLWFIACSLSQDCDFSFLQSDAPTRIKRRQQQKKNLSERLVVDQVFNFYMTSGLETTKS